MRLRVTAVAALMICAGMAQAQFNGKGPRDPFRDTSVLKPPAGNKVAILVWEDLGCPGCARWHPYEHEVAAKTGVKLVRRDFPLEQHIWTFEGAVFARFLEDRVNAKTADLYRDDVFKNQMMISSKDDLHQFNVRWMKEHKLQMPFAVDPTGQLAKEVQADLDLGNRLRVQYTPTIVVVTNNEYQVVAGAPDAPSDPAALLPTVEGALKKVGGTAHIPTAHPPMKKR